MDCYFNILSQYYDPFPKHHDDHKSAIKRPPRPEPNPPRRYGPYW